MVYSNRNLFYMMGLSPTVVQLTQDWFACMTPCLLCVYSEVLDKGEAFLKVA